MEGFPGLSLAVTDRDGLVASETFGLANVDAGMPMSRETYFEFGSIGKTFTTVLRPPAPRTGARSTSRRP